ncbi:centrosomal protein 76kDa [Strigomonas culicis]|nr:centrosomal protein 76kDa [Strigomonas culicis]|eukprot:EPY28807.1 centrosomal protein 76kDa [Strigomonas culicis]
MTSEGAIVSPERLDEMKSAIHSFLAKSNVYDSIRDIVDTYVSENKDSAIQADSPSDIMRIIKEKGILNELVSKLKSGPGLAPSKKSKQFAFVEGECYLHARLTGGRAFVDNVDLMPSALKNYSLFVCVHFGSQRFRSSPTNCSTDPKFDDDFLFNIEASSLGYSSSDLIEVPYPLHIAVFRESKLDNVAELLGENMCDWRKVLRSNFLSLTIELCGRNAGVPAGIVELQLELLPGSKTQYSENEISSRLEKQRLAILTADREFLLYARRWWSEYQSARETHKDRKVKVFASTSNGRMVPVTHFVSPMQAECHLSSPLDAARFVSLFKVLNEHSETPLQSIENETGSGWLSASVFLSQRQGSQCNHATLLCSLLLGFSLDAFCAMGTSRNGNVVMFVVTLSRDSSGVAQATIWDPVSGERNPVNGAHAFATVDCLFNGKSFFANFQASNSLLTASFEVENEELWKPLNPLKLRIVPKIPHAPILCQDVRVPEMEKSLEMGLREYLIARRNSMGVMTQFNDDLSYALAQALQ